jgi:cellobiose dehydrogenase (acceptor)
MNVVLLLLSSSTIFLVTYAQSHYCSWDGICISVVIPGELVTTENPYFRAIIQAPSSAKWFAIGLGTQMANSIMFVAWPYDNEVILSSRLAPYLTVLFWLICRGEGLPPVYEGPSIDILSSNIAENATTVQFQCSNCTTWSGGSLDLNSTSADFIYAWGNMEPLEPSESNSTFFIHVDYGNFKLNLKSAQTGLSTTNGTTSLNFTTVHGARQSLTRRQKV